MPLLPSATAYPPQEVYPPPEQTYTPPPPPPPAPVEQAPPQVAAQPVQQVEPQGTVLSDTPGYEPGQAAPTAAPQETILSDTPGYEPQSPQAGPPDTGKALDAVGATAAQIPGALLTGPAKTVEAAKAAPGAVQEFTGTGGRKATYRPAPAGTAPAPKGENQGAILQAQKNAKVEADKVYGGDLGNIGNMLGAGKDVVLAATREQMGEALPWPSGNRRAQMDAVYQVLKTGEWPDWAKKGQLVAPNGTPLSPSFQTDYENAPDLQPILTSTGQARQNFIDAYEQGYTDDDNVIHPAGPDAMWYWTQAQRSGGQKLAADLMSDPTTAPSILTDVVGGVGKGLAIKAAEQAERTGAKTGGMALLGKGLQGTAEVANAVQTLGLSVAAPLAFKGAGKAYSAIPWFGKQTEGALQQQAVRDVVTPAGEVLSARRAGEGQLGVPTIAPASRITQPTADKQISRVFIPEEAGNPAIDITYHVDKKGKLDGVYDTAIPAPGERYRPLTQADAQGIYDAWGRLPEADRQALRSTAFPRLSRVETSPGEPFIEQGAERYTDVSGNPVNSGRIGTGYEREVNDLHGALLRSANPDHILTDFRSSWLGNLFDGKLHPLTRRPIAESRLQTLRDVMDRLPASYRTPEREAMFRQMKDMVPRDPPPIGTGNRWEGAISGNTLGRLVPLRPRETQWLSEMARRPLESFKKKGLDAGRVGGKNGLNVIFDRKPPTTAPPAFHNGYTAYLDMMDHRTKSPAGGRAQLADLKSEVQGLLGSPSPSAESRVDAIKEVWERGGFLPGASSMDDATFLTESENYLRATRPTFPPLPGAVSTAPHGTFPAGSQDELWGQHLTDPVRDALDTHIDIGGTTRTAGQRLFTHWEETETAWVAARHQAQGFPVDAADQRLLNTQVAKISNRFGGAYKNLTAAKFATFKPGEIDRIAGALLGSDMQISQGVRSATGKVLTPAEKSGLVGKLLAPYDNFLAKWRSTVLYNVARGIQYPMLQAAGNLVTLGIANRSAIPFYLNPTQWPRAWSYLRNPETEALPNVIVHRDAVGLARSDNLGRVSRDQIGARTGFEMEGSHPFTRAIGKVLANPAIKDFGDMWDMNLRHAVYGSVFEPAYRRLKNDLPAMADSRLQRQASSRGVPLTVTRTQLDSAVKSLEGSTGGYFNQPQLKQALYEAMGGSSAANQKFTLDAADRVARDYHAELKKLDDVAQTEVNRVAFAGGDTNAEAALSRVALFTWWIARASRLYATEAAKSPIQMGIWARAIEAGNQRERAGTDPRYKQYVDFMQTPAGYTVGLNPFSLAGSWILGSSADPTDARANMTALGELTEGGIIGDNLVLSPLLKAAGFALGALGQDARTPDIFGVNRFEKELVDGFNYFNTQYGNWMQTKGGNPDLLPYPGVSQGMINFLAQQISGRLPGTQQVAGFDPSAGQEAQIANLVAEQVIRDNPDLDPTDPGDADTLEMGVNEAMKNHDSKQYQEALGRYTDSLYLGPGSGDQGWQNVAAGIASHFVLPTSFSRQPTFRDERNQRKGRDELRKEGADWLTPDKEMSAFDKKTGYLGAMSPAGRDFALTRDRAAGDPQTKATTDLFYGIQNNKVGDLKATLNELGLTDVSINGYHFTAEQIASLPEDDRKALASAWRDASGSGPIMDEYYATRDKQLKADKAYADAQGWPKYAEQYPGGIDRAVDDTVQENPNYKKLIEGYAIIDGVKTFLPDLRVTNHAQWADFVTNSTEAKQTIAGIKDSRYGLDIDPKYAGMVAGEPHVGAWLIAQNEEQAANRDNEFTVGLRDDYQKFTKLSESMDKLDTQWGRPVGTTKALFVQGALAGGLDSATDKSYALPIDEHNALKAMGVSDSWETYRLKSYLEWSIQQPAGTDTSIDKYNDAYWAKTNAEAVPDIYARLATGQVPALTAEGTAAPSPDALANLVYNNGTVSTGVRAGPSTIAAPTILASEPGGTQGVRVPAGLPVQTGDMKSGSDGSVWVLVQAGPGVSGWINVSQLAPAA